MFRKNMTADQLTEVFETADAFGVPDDLTPLMMLHGLISKEDIKRIFEQAGAFDSETGKTSPLDIESFEYEEGLYGYPFAYDSAAIAAVNDSDLIDCLDKYGRDEMESIDLNSEPNRCSTIVLLNNILSTKEYFATWALHEYLKDGFFDAFPELNSEDEDGSESNG